MPPYFTVIHKTHIKRQSVTLTFPISDDPPAIRDTIPLIKNRDRGIGSSPGLDYVALGNTKLLSEITVFQCERLFFRPGLEKFLSRTS
jgi:hypothetical protein